MTPNVPPSLFGWIQPTGLTNMGFIQSTVDERVWYRGDIIFTFYVDNWIIWCSRTESIEEFMRHIRNVNKAGKEFDIKGRGDGINFSRQKDGRLNYCNRN